MSVDYGYNRTIIAADQPAAIAAAAAKAAAAAAKAAKDAAHMPLTEKAFDALYAHITCPLCKRTAINFGDPNRKCTTHTKGGAKKRSRRLRRGKSKSKFQRRGKSVKRRRRH